jgi:hypothetical protein
LTFLVGLALGIVVGALAGARSLPGLKKDLDELLGTVAPEAREASEQAENGLTERWRRAQDVYEKTLKATRQRLHRELDSARLGRNP